MAIIPGAIGASGVLRSGNTNNEDTINWPVVPAGPGAPRHAIWQMPSPGVRIYVALGAGPIRGLFSQDNRCYAVGGNRFGEVLNTQNFLPLTGPGTNQAGLFLALGGRASIVRNSIPIQVVGAQIFIASGHSGYSYDMQAIVVDVALDFPCGNADYLDNRFVSFEWGTNILRWSDLEDGTSWPSLNFAQISWSSDNIMEILVIHGQWWVFGSATSQVWYGVGGVQVFAPIPGSLMEYGTVSADSVAVIDNAPFWVGKNQNGTALVLRGQGVGAVPTVVSSPAVEFDLSTAAARLAETVAFTFQMEGNPFFGLYVPGLDWTWIYNVRIGAEFGWTKWALWDSTAMQWIPHVTNSHTFTFGKHLVGSRLNDCIYDLSLNYGSDQLVP